MQSPLSSAGAAAAAAYNTIDAEPSEIICDESLSHNTPTRRGVDPDTDNDKNDEVTISRPATRKLKRPRAKQMSMNMIERKLKLAFASRARAAPILDESLRLRFEQLPGSQHIKILEFLHTDSKEVLDTISLHGLRALCAITGAKSKIGIPGMIETVYAAQLLNPRSPEFIEADESEDDSNSLTVEQEEEDEEQPQQTTSWCAGRDTNEHNNTLLSTMRIDDRPGGKNRVTTDKIKPRAPKLDHDVIYERLHSFLTNDLRQNEEDNASARSAIMKKGTLFLTPEQQTTVFVANAMERVNKLSGLQQRLVVDFVECNDAELLTRMSMHGLRAACYALRYKQDNDAQNMVDILKRRRTGVNLFGGGSGDTNATDGGQANRLALPQTITPRRGNSNGHNKRASDRSTSNGRLKHPRNEGSSRNSVRIGDRHNQNSSVNNENEGRPSGEHVRRARSRSGGRGSHSNQRRSDGRPLANSDDESNEDDDEYVHGRSILVARKICEAAKALMKQAQLLRSSGNNTLGAKFEKRAKGCMKEDPGDSPQVKALLHFSKITMLCDLADRLLAMSENALGAGNVDLYEELSSERLGVLNETYDGAAGSS